MTETNNFEGEYEAEDNQPIVFGYFLPNNQYVMVPQWYTYFMQYYQHLAQLYQLPPPNCTEQQTKAYYQYLNVVNTYITNSIFTGYVMYYNVFETDLENYQTLKNPQGYSLYMKQADYIDKKKSGYNFKLDKKKGGKQQQQPKKKQISQLPKKEQVDIIRKEDPKIDIEVLTSTQWDSAKYKNIQLLKKTNVNLIFIGHVDAGKSTLSGRILKNLKQVDEQQLKKNQQQAKSFHREGWELAYITDISQQQKEKGKTVECSKTLFELANRRYTLFDAPGHKNYVPNMIMGACQADLAVLIISAKEGQFESGFDKQGQTKQHAMLAKALSVTNLFCVVTKMETVGWSQERFKLIKDQVTPFLKNNCGYQNVQFIPIDSIRDTNIDVRNTKQVCKWYNGPAFLQVLDSTQIPKRFPTAPLRIPIIDKLKDQGQLYIFGKVESGTILQDQTVSLLPTKAYFLVKEIFNPKDQRIPYGIAGENVKLKVRMIQEQDIKRGYMICNNLNYAQVCYQFQAKITVLQLPENKKLMSQGYQCVIHLHAVVDSVEIVSVEAAINPQNKKLVKTTFLKSLQTGIVKIRCSNQICLEKFQFMQGLGRFTLRDEGKTIGYGEVLKIKPSQSLTAQQKTQLGLAEKEAKTVEAVRQTLQNKLKI